MTSLTPRAANPTDIHEIIRLAHVMWDDMGYWPEDDAWQKNTIDVFTQGIEADEFHAIVVDDPNEPGRLIACGLSNYAQQIPAFWNPSGKMGYFQWLCVEPNFRRQKIATEILQRLIEWLSLKGVDRAQLHATEDGKALYEELGFEPSEYTNYWISIGRPSVHPNKPTNAD